MSNLILLIVCFLLGVLLRRTGRLPEATPSVLNAFIINVSLPALTLLYVHELPVDRSLAYPTAMAWVLFGLGVIFFVTLGRALGWSRRTVGGLILVGGLANTSFLGLPMIEAFYGEEHLGLGIREVHMGRVILPVALDHAELQLAGAQALEVEDRPVGRLGPAGDAVLGRVEVDEMADRAADLIVNAGLAARPDRTAAAGWRPRSTWRRAPTYGSSPPMPQPGPKRASPGRSWAWLRSCSTPSSGSIWGRLRSAGLRL